ncbi:MarR family protein [Anatilimnocola aggregata]|uniref:MarR family protein n=1 Tax=Anatilimnocola aggregata TaxID=2528021 RepID=A0A517Y9M7_9BACT|nr:winged helix-turn-helix transcriptional regulator [Anatilimnocola aggregata]QDU26926.1 MarR family protein [Anatilimnocola aggregata]
MTTTPETSDLQVLDLLRKNSAMSVSQLISSTGVTATAVRQRLTRLLKQGLIERAANPGSRGRPSHKYTLTDLGRRSAGANFADLAVALWQEVRDIKDQEIRRGLLKRLSKRMAESYAEQIQGNSIGERMESLAELFSARQIPFDVKHIPSAAVQPHNERSLPVLSAHACPYPALAEQDQSICALEKMMFSELLGENVKLASCRLNGDHCCTFEPAGGHSSAAISTTSISQSISPGPLVEVPAAAVS